MSLNELLIEAARTEILNQLLIEEAQKGRLDIVKYLVEHGADIHARDNAALRVATEENHWHIMKYLAEKMEQKK